MKLQKTITAGRLGFAAAYTMPNTRTDGEERRQSREATAGQIARTNGNTVRRKPALLLAANLEPH